MTSTVASLVQSINVHTNDINAVSFSSQLLATASSDKTVRLWNTDDFTEATFSPLCGHTYQVYCCVFSSFGKYLATGSMDGKLILWDTKTGQRLASFQHQSKNCIRSCCFSPDSTTLVSGCDDNTLCLWDLGLRKFIRSLEIHEASVVTCVYSPDSVFLVSGSTDGDLTVWDGKYGHGKPLTFTMDGHDLGVTGCDFSPTYGSATVSEPLSTHYLLASCGNDNLVKLWDMTGGLGGPNVKLSLRDTLMGHTCQVMSCCFSPNGTLLASGSGDKTVRLWDPHKGEPLHCIESHSRFVTCCAFSADSVFLATGSNDRTVLLWKITQESQLTDSATYEEVIDSLPSNDTKAPSTSLYFSLNNWTLDHVASWLTDLDLAQYIDTFRQHHIDGQELANLNRETLEFDLQIASLGHRNKLLREIENLKKQTSNPSVLKSTIDNSSSLMTPDEYLCPISREIMNDPVIAADGYTYERSDITAWLKSGKTRSPMTNVFLPNSNLLPNRSIKMLIQNYIKKQ